MEIDLKYTEDVIEAYSGRRPTVTYEDTEDLMRIFIKYLRIKIKSNDHYAINTPLGIFYKELNKEMLSKVEKVAGKEEKLNEKIFINSQIKWNVRKDYSYDDLELIKNNTNNSPLKS